MDARIIKRTTIITDTRSKVIHSPECGFGYIRLCGILSLGLLFLLFAACTPVSNNMPQPISQVVSNTVYEIHPIFNELYPSLGGEEMLGPVISPLFDDGDLQCQYTYNTLMCFNPTIGSVDGYLLAPLGNILSIEKDSPIPYLNSDNKRIIDGYEIFPDFVPLYDRLFGERFVGKPLTQPRFNFTWQRIEQYFENVVFAREIGDTLGTAHLLSLGLHFCADRCGYTNMLPNSDISLQQDLFSPFVYNLLSPSGIELLGKPLTRAYIGQDGFSTQIFENAVLFAPPDNIAAATLRPISRELGMTTTEMGPKIYGAEQQVVFYSLEGELGYHVPFDIDTFITDHGGRTVVGNPIAETIQDEDGTLRQCFENYCLDYDINAPLGTRTQAVPLGAWYLQKALDASNIDPALVLENYQPIQNPLPGGQIILSVWEEKNQIRSNEIQTIYLFIVQGDNREPLPNIETELVLTLPDSSRYDFVMPLTGATGYSGIAIPPMPEQENGTVVTYQACLKLDSGEPVCASDAYLIWNE